MLHARLTSNRELKSVNWIITDTCNGRCVHCDMWQPEGRRTDLGLEAIASILADESIRKGYDQHGRDFDISFAGGEPFVRQDLQAIVDLVEKTYPGSFKCITTNALLKDRVLRFVEMNLHLGFKLNISIEGLEEVHDVMRGQGAFRKTLDAILAVRKQFPRQAVEIKLVVSPHNHDQILRVYWLAAKLGCDFSFKPVENLQNFTNSRHPIEVSFTREQVCIIRNQCFKMADMMYRKGDFKKARFYQDIPFYLGRKKMPTSCSVLNDHLTIMPAGESYFCIKEPSVGSLPQQPLKAIRKIHDLDEFKCHSCMLLCGAYKDYPDGPFVRTVANVELINRCNLQCPYCTQKGFDAFDAQVMGLEAFRCLIKEHPQITHVSFIGGESFMNKDFFAIMEHLDRKGITYEITTNGTLINEQTIDRLKGCIGLKNILFSLDGLEASHDKERGAGTFKKCVHALGLMKGHFTTGVCSVFKADNQDDLIELTRMLADMDVNDHRIIYGMSHSEEAVAESRKLAPHLVFQGPRFDRQVVDYERTMKFFETLEQAARARQIKVSYVPELFRSRTKPFLDGNLAQTGRVRCIQLEQLRFDASCQRIVCEFIRNPYNNETAGILKQGLLPLCEKCCKLRNDET